MSAVHQAAALLAEIQRRKRLRDLVRQAGYSAAAADEWVPRADITRAVAALTGTHASSFALGTELRQFLLVEGWRERRIGSGWQWRAVYVKPRHRHHLKPPAP